MMQFILEPYANSSILVKNLYWTDTSFSGCSEDSFNSALTHSNGCIEAHGTSKKNKIMKDWRHKLHHA